MNARQFTVLVSVVAVLTIGLGAFYAWARYWGPHSRSVSLGASGGPDAVVAIGQPLPRITLKDIDGETLDLQSARGRMVVLLVQGNACPCSAAYIPRMNTLAKTYGPRGVDVWAFNSNVNETEEETRANARKRNVLYRVAHDPESRVADILGAACTTEVWVVDRQGVLQYHGRIDDNIYKPEKVQRRDLQAALDALLDGRPAPTPETQAFACTIVREGGV